MLVRETGLDVVGRISRGRLGNTCPTYEKFNGSCVCGPSRGEGRRNKKAKKNRGPTDHPAAQFECNLLYPVVTGSILFGARTPCVLPLNSAEQRQILLPKSR
jgi:hypothetical protein